MGLSTRKVRKWRVGSEGVSYTGIWVDRILWKICTKPIWHSHWMRKLISQPGGPQGEQVALQTLHMAGARIRHLWGRRCCPTSIQGPLYHIYKGRIYLVPKNSASNKKYLGWRLIWLSQISWKDSSYFVLLIKFSDRISSKLAHPSFALHIDFGH